MLESETVTNRLAENKSDEEGEDEDDWRDVSAEADFRSTPGAG
jgi:hypothetical protein